MVVDAKSRHDLIGVPSKVHDKSNTEPFKDKNESLYQTSGCTCLEKESLLHKRPERSKVTETNILFDSINGSLSLTSLLKDVIQKETGHLTVPTCSATSSFSFS